VNPMLSRAAGFRAAQSTREKPDSVGGRIAILRQPISLRHRNNFFSGAVLACVTTLRVRGELQMKRSLWALVLMLAASGVCSAQQFTYYYPQIASGAYDGGSWQTTIFITNTGSSLASGSIALTRDDGSP